MIVLPDGSNGDVQYNQDGVFTASSTFHYDPVTGVLYVGSVTCSAGCGGGVGSPGGSITQVQYYDSGATFGGNSAFTFDKASGMVYVGSQTATRNGYVEDQDGDLWILSNASYTASTGKFTRINKDKAAWGLEMQGAGLFPGEIDSGWVIWRATAAVYGTREISTTFGAVGGWELGFDVTSNRDLVVGGGSIEMDGFGSFPYGRLIHSTLSGRATTGVGRNIYNALSAHDSSSYPDLFMGFSSDTFKVQVGSAQVTPNLRTIFEASTGIPAIPLIGAVAAATYYGDGSHLTGISGGGSGDMLLASTQTMSAPHNFSNATTAPAMTVTQIGDTGTTPGTGASIVVDNTLNTGNGIQVYTNRSNGTQLNGLISLYSNTTSYDEPMLYIKSLSTGTVGANADIRIDANNPDIEFVETDQVAPAGKFEIAVQSNVLQFNARNQANTAFQNYLSMNATGALRFKELDNGGDFVGFQATNTMTSSVIWTLPAADSAGFWQSNGAGVLSLSNVRNSATSASGLEINQTATTPDDYLKGALAINNTGNNGIGLAVYSNQGGTQVDPLINIKVGNQNFGTYVMMLDVAATNYFATTIEMQAPIPSIEFRGNLTATPINEFQISEKNDDLRLEGRQADDNGFGSIMVLSRPTTGTPAGGLVYIGNNYVDPLNSLDVGGDTTGSSVGHSSATVAIGRTYAGVALAPPDGLLVEGSVGIGLTAPLAKLVVSGDASSGNGVFQTITNTNGYSWYAENTAAASASNYLDWAWILKGAVGSELMGDFKVTSSNVNLGNTTSDVDIGVKHAGSQSNVLHLAGSDLSATVKYLNATSSVTTAAERITGLNCTGNTNSGKVTANASGILACADDISGSGGSGTTISIEEGGSSVVASSSITFNAAQFNIASVGGKGSVVIDTTTGNGSLVEFASATAMFLDKSSATATYLNKLVPYVSSINATSPVAVTGNGTAGSAPTISITGVGGLTGLLTDQQKIKISTGGTQVAISSAVNFQEGTATTLTTSVGTDGTVNIRYNSTASGSGDNLGSHVATTTLNMAGFGITNVASMTFLGAGAPAIDIGTYTALAIMVNGSTWYFNASSITYGGTSASLGTNIQASSAALTLFFSDNQVRTNLGLAIGTNVQAWDADLDDLADGSLTGSKVGAGIPDTSLSSQVDLLNSTQTMSARKTFAEMVVNSTFTVNTSTLVINGTTSYWTITRPAGNRIFQMDSSGNVTLVTDQTSAGGGDNLGSHVATMTLNMAGFGMINIASMSATTGTIAGAAILSENNSFTMTNKTFDANGTGNTLKYTDVWEWGNTNMLLSGTSYYTTTSTNAPYGHATFAGSNSTSTCGVVIKRFAGADFDTGTDLTMILHVIEFATEGSSQTFIVSVATYTTGMNVSTMTYGSPISVVIATNAAVGGLYKEGISASTTLTGWKSIISANTDFAIAIRRQGDSATLDPSQLDSYFDSVFVTRGKTQ